MVWRGNNQNDNVFALSLVKFFFLLNQILVVSIVLLHLTLMVAKNKMEWVRPTSSCIRVRISLHIDFHSRNIKRKKGQEQLP